MLVDMKCIYHPVILRKKTQNSRKSRTDARRRRRSG